MFFPLKYYCFDPIIKIDNYKSNMSLLRKGNYRLFLQIEMDFGLFQGGRIYEQYQF